MYMSCGAMRGFVILINFNLKNSHSNVAYIRATFDNLQTMNDEWEAISGHCPPSSAILDHLPYKSCWEVDIRSRRLLEANGSKWQPLEGINDYWGPSWVYWDWFLLEQLGAINVRACLPGSRHIVQRVLIQWNIIWENVRWIKVDILSLRVQLRYVTFAATICSGTKQWRKVDILYNT